MKENKLKVILFDLGNVLINFDHRIAVRRILPYTKKKIDDIYCLFFDSTLTKDYEEGRISSRVFFKKISEELGLKGLSFRKFAIIWNEIFYANRGILKLLEALKKQYRLHLVSNINELHYLYIEKKFPRHIGVFDKVILSYEVGRRKPSQKIYHRAVRNEGFKYDEVLYTDDRADLIKEAKKLGMPSIVFRGVEDFHKRLKELKVLT